MCRYAEFAPYKTHYACFECRKAFKQPPIEDFLSSRGLGFVFAQLKLLRSSKTALAQREAELGHRLDDLCEEYRSEIHQCPECGDPMADLGLDFKPPRQANVKAWKILQGMYRIGHEFRTCGCDAFGLVPRSTSDYRAYLLKQKRHYEERLESTHSELPPAALDKAEEMRHWSKSIQAVDAEMGKVG